MPSRLPTQRITVEEYYRMAETGRLSPEARVELIEGAIVDMPPIGSLHEGIVTRLNRLLLRAVGDQAIVRCQQSLRLDSFSEPQPDLALVRPRDDDYMKSHPTSSDTLLLIEVSNTSLPHDRDVKVPLYARHGIPEVWLVDLNQRQLHILRKPTDAGYAYSFSTGAPGATPISTLPGITVDLSQLLEVC